MTYQKLVSCNPDEYEEIDAEMAILRYTQYLVYYSRSAIIDTDLFRAKTFKEWVETEI